MKGFKMGVDEITQKMERYTDELKHNEGRLGEMTHNLNVVNTRLKQVDERLRQLRPGMRLDSLEDRCKHGYNIINPRRMRCRVTVVVLFVCLLPH